MIRNKSPKVPIFRIIALVTILAAVLSPGHRALAAGSRILTLSDMGNESFCEAGPSGATIAGATYAHSILFAGDAAFVTLFPHAFPGYAAFTAAVGIEDGSSTPSGTATVSVTVDGKQVKSLTKASGQAATILTVPFGQASQIKLTVHENQKNTLYLLLGDPRVVTSAPAAVATPAPIAGGGKGNGGTAGGGGAGKTTLTLFSASVAAGGQETALITTGAAAALTIVITYPGGTQQVLGPRKAGPDGHFAYSWAVPGGVAGIVRVVVVSSSVAQATFTIQ